MKKNATVIVIVTIILGAGVAWYYYTNSGNEPPLTAADTSNTAAQVQFQALVAKLQSITFDTSIFTDPKFVSLVDITQPISPEPTGRSDPFAEVGR